MPQRKIKTLTPRKGGCNRGNDGRSSSSYDPNFQVNVLETFRIDSQRVRVALVIPPSRWTISIICGNSLHKTALKSHASRLLCLSVARCPRFATVFWSLNNGLSHNLLTRCCPSACCRLGHPSSTASGTHARRSSCRPPCRTAFAGCACSHFTCQRNVTNVGRNSQAIPQQLTVAKSPFHQLRYKTKRPKLFRVMGRQFEQPSLEACSQLSQPVAWFLNGPDGLPRFGAEPR